MPVPAVYIVAAVVGGAVAAIAFKEFVFDPYIAPEIKAWRESRQRRPWHPMQRRRRSRSRCSSASSSSDDADTRGDVNNISVEMEDLVCSERREWRTANEETILRHRTNLTNQVLDESNVFIPFDPMTPSSLTSPSNSTPSTPPVTECVIQPLAPPIVSPLPRFPIRAEALQAAIISQTAPFHLRLSNATSPELQPSEARPASPSTNSDSAQSSFTPAVVGPSSPSSLLSRSAFSDGGRSTTYDFVTGSEDETRPSEFRVMSPFLDIHHPRSPEVATVETRRELQSPRSDIDSDFAILSPSLRSGMFSPPINLDDDPFGDDDSIGSDDFAAWDGLDRRTPSP